MDRASGAAVARRVDGIGTPNFPAPQANLMAVLISGLLDHKLPVGPRSSSAPRSPSSSSSTTGHSLTFAVGVYLPLSSTMPIFIGGLVRKLADRRYGRVPDDAAESEGTLLSSGLIAGGALVGVAVALLHFPVFGLAFDDDLDLPMKIALGPEILARGLLLGPRPDARVRGLGWLLFRGARDPEKTTGERE